MTISTFLFLLFAFSALTGLVVEGIKQNFMTNQNKKYNIIALLVALAIGLVGTMLYYHFNGLPLDVDAFIFAVLMGLASALVSMTGFDKVKQAIEQLQR